MREVFRMHLFFGMAADGRTYPEAPHPCGGLDEAVVGPAGLVALLEAQLGLSAPVAPRTVRIAAYLSKLRQAGDARFWQRSFSKDPWSTATELLSWRDMLVAGGWAGSALGTSRIDDLAAAEAAGQPLPPGLPDRAIALVSCLPSRPGLRLTRLVLLDKLEMLPSPWSALVKALGDAGVVVEPDQSGDVFAEPNSDLRQVQAALAGREHVPLTGDGSFAVVQADTALMAAEAVAEWLSAGSPEALEGTVVLAPDGDTALLDRALKSRGLPALGLSGASPWRGALQVLPLAFAVAWSPFDPKALLNLLLLPRPPVPRFVARRLARALSAEPGLDGQAWNKAWEDIEARALQFNADAGEKAEAKTKQDITRWRSWTVGAQFDRSGGMPAAEVRSIASRVATWALEIDAGAGDPLLLAVAGAATDLSKAVDLLGLGALPALLLERIISQVLAEGLQNPRHTAEAGGLRAVRSPGAVWGATPRLIWWNFVGPGEQVIPCPWSREELSALEAAQVYFEPPSLASQRIGESYVRVLQRATDRVLLVRPTLSGSEETVAHPLAHQLRPVLASASQGIFFRAERLLRYPDAELAGRVITRAAVETLEPPKGRAVWRLPASASLRVENRRESATSLRRLLNCQMAWFTQDVLGIRPGTFAVIPGPDQLFGNIAHEIARRLLPPGAPPPPGGIREQAAQLFEGLLPQMAAPLQQREFAGELAAARELIPRALEALVQLLHDGQLEVVGAELERSGQLGGLELQGRLDFVVKKGQRKAVLDLKWTRSERRYAEEISDGKAVQLAVYHGIAGSPGEVGDGGYFLLRQRRVLAPVGSILAGSPINAVRSDADTLKVVAADWAVWSQLAREGTALAAGVEGAEDHRPADLGFAQADQPCRYCDLTGLCRVHVEVL